MSVQAVPSFEVWILNDLPYAVSQLRVTELMVSVAPRSTWSHCGSAAALDQRVPALPSTAAEAGVPAFSVDEAVAVLPCDRRVPAAWADRIGTNSSSEATSAVRMAATTLRRFDSAQDLGAVGLVGGAIMSTLL